MLDLKRVSHASIFLLFIFIAKSALSLLLRSLIASNFGAGTETDAYYAAFTIPQQLSDFFIGGILFAAIIPVFQKRREESGEEEASKDISALLNAGFVVLLAITAAFYFSVPWLTKLVFSGFNDEKLAITIRYSRIFSPAILLFGFALIYTSLYHAFRDFFVPSIAALTFPASSILSIFCLPSSWGIERLIYGNLAGSLIGLLLMMAFIRKRISWKWCWNIRNPLIMATMLISWPVLLENVFLKLIPFIKNKIASELPLNGAITMIELAFFVVSSTVIFISGPISTAIFPFMGKQQAEKRESELFATFIKSLCVILLFAIPLNVILFTESYEIVRILFGRGKFSDEDCLITSRLIMIISLIIIPSSFQSISGRMFFILQDTRLRSFVSIALIVLGTPSYFIMADLLGIYGLMGACAGMAILGGSADFLLIKRKFRGYSTTSFYVFLIKSLTAALAMGILVCAVKAILLRHACGTLLTFSVSSFLGICGYAGFCFLLKVDEFNYLTNELRMRTEQAYKFMRYR